MGGWGRGGRFRDEDERSDEFDERLSVRRKRLSAVKRSARCTRGVGGCQPGAVGTIV